MTMGALISPRATRSFEAQARLGAFAVAQPADARRQPLERNARLRHRDPAAQRRILWE